MPCFVMTHGRVAPESFCRRACAADVGLEASTSGREASEDITVARPAHAERLQLASAALAGWRGRTTSLLSVAAAVGGFFGAPARCSSAERVCCRRRHASQ